MFVKILKLPLFLCKSPSGSSFSALTALSPLDGRYASQTADLQAFFSESALMRYRVKVEVEWLKFLGRERMIKLRNGEVHEFNQEHLCFLDSLVSRFDQASASRIKAIERTTNHDVKAVEYYIKERITASQHSALADIREYVHFCCTSEDINNLSYSLMLTESKSGLLVPLQAKILEKLAEMAGQFSAVSMLSRTHGQPASPTTLGKEIANFAYRLGRQARHIRAQRFCGKINGAVGNFNAHFFVYPEYDWESISQRFVEGLGLEFNPYTTQIEPHDSIAEFCTHLALFNTILVGLSQDFWHYISLSYFTQRTVAAEVGSSTMPHKVNPIDFENCEGNLGLSNALAEFIARKLPISRFQRDLSDSTVMRNLGSIYGYSIMAYSSLLKGLGKLAVNKTRIAGELAAHSEVLAEPIQMMLRKKNVEGAYEILKEMTRGKTVTGEDIARLIEGLAVDQETKQKLRTLTVEGYVGNAEKMAKVVRNLAKL